MEATTQTYDPERQMRYWLGEALRQREAEQDATRRLEAAAERGARQVAGGVLLTVPTVAALLSVSEDFVRDHAGELGGCRVGSRLRFRRASVDAWIDSQRLAPAASVPARRPGPRRAPGEVELLPLPGRRDEG